VSDESPTPTDETLEAADRAGATEATDDESATGPETFATEDAAPKRRRGRLIAATVLAVLIVVSAGVTAWLYFATYRPDQATDEAAVARAVDAAKEGTVAALSYSPDDLDKDLGTAKSHLTGQFLQYYSDFTDQVVRPAVAQKKVSTTANVVQAAISEMHPDNATVLVFVNQTTTSADRADPSLATSSVVVKMNKIDGKWLISEFNPV